MSDPAHQRGDFRPLSPFATGLHARCPRCGRGQIFDGFLQLRSSCSVCGLDLTVADTGDGPSFFVSFIGGFLILGAGVIVQTLYDPDVWVYALLLAIGALVCVGMLRPIKGLLVALQYTNKAEQGVFKP